MVTLLLPRSRDHSHSVNQRIVMAHGQPEVVTYVGHVTNQRPVWACNEDVMWEGMVNLEIN